MMTGAHRGPGHLLSGASLAALSASPGAASSTPRWRSRLNSAISDTSRSARRLDSWSTSACVSSWTQSTGRPSETEPARESSLSSALMTHDVRQLPERALDRHARRVPAPPLGDGRHLLVTEIELDAQMEQPALVIGQPRERALVPIQGLGADRALERRRRCILEGLGDGVLPGPPPRPAHLIPDTIEHGLANIGLEHTRSPDLDGIQDLDGAKQRLLHEVIGVEEGAGVGGEPPAGPACESGAVALHQGAERGAVAPFGPAQEVAGDHELGSRRTVVGGMGHDGAPLVPAAGRTARPSRRCTVMPHGSRAVIAASSVRTSYPRSSARAAVASTVGKSGSTSSQCMIPASSGPATGEPKAQVLRPT